MGIESKEFSHEIQHQVDDGNIFLLRDVRSVSEDKWGKLRANKHWFR